jgi:hypothetical protein
VLGSGIPSSSLLIDLYSYEMQIATRGIAHTVCANRRPLGWR